MVVIGAIEFAGESSKNIKSYPQSYPQIVLIPLAAFCGFSPSTICGLDMVPAWQKKPDTVAGHVTPCGAALREVKRGGVKPG
jgi:hypothetical protein